MSHFNSAIAERQVHKSWTLVLAALAVFMTALDALVVTTALPAIGLWGGIAGLAVAAARSWAGRS